MKRNALPRSVVDQIGAIVDEYIAHRTDLFNLARRVENDLIENQNLRKLIHSTKFREKDPEHLREKLTRKAIQAASEGKRFNVTRDNVFA